MNPSPTPPEPKQPVIPPSIRLEAAEGFSQTSYLHNSLESYEPLIQQLISQFALIHHHGNHAQNLLEIIRYVSDAEFTCVIGWDGENSQNLVAVSDCIPNPNLNLSVEDRINNVISELDLKILSNPAYCGNYIRYPESENRAKNLIAIPIESEIILISGLPNNIYFYTEIYSKIISSFYKSAQSKSSEISLIEAAIIDQLKQSFGFVSASLYQRRFELFCQRLQRMVIYFEPVLHLGSSDMFISGWEALARNPESLNSPSELFKAAELWGANYTLKLDQYFLITAVHTYRQVSEQRQRRASDLVPLSVNVYPETLIRSEYFDTLNQLIKEHIIAPRNLILEISEKSALPQLENPLVSFKNCLIQYVKKLNIRFAIDDFGVGYASVSRLAGLNPSHVKIDREILYHETCHVIIKFVHEMVGVNNLNPANVIVEGIDETTPVSLRLLKKLGVSYIQGHIVGKSQPEIYRLTQEKMEELMRLIV